MMKCNWVMYRLDWGFPQDPFYKLEGLGGMLQNDIAYTQLPIILPK